MLKVKVKNKQMLNNYLFRARRIWSLFNCFIKSWICILRSKLFHKGLIQKIMQFIIYSCYILLWLQIIEFSCYQVFCLKQLSLSKCAPSFHLKLCQKIIDSKLWQKILIVSDNCDYLFSWQIKLIFFIIFFFY